MMPFAAIAEAASTANLVSLLKDLNGSDMGNSRFAEDLVAVAGIAAAILRFETPYTAQNTSIPTADVTGLGAVMATALCISQDHGKAGVPEGARPD